MELYTAFTESMFDLSCLSTGGMDGNMSECMPAGPGSGSGSGIRSGAAHCRLQDSIVIICNLCVVSLLISKRMWKSCDQCCGLNQHPRYTVHRMQWQSQR